MKLLKPELKVLFVSGYADDEVFKRGANDGAPPLHKPFTLHGVVHPRSCSTQTEVPHIVLRRASAWSRAPKTPIGW